MKKSLVSIVVVLVILATSWTVFGQEEARRGQPREGRDWRMFQMLSPEEAAQMREKWQSMSEEEREKFRAQMREKWEKISEEEKGKLNIRMRERFGSRREQQLEAIKAIEEQLGKLKARIEATASNEQRPFQELSDEERTKLRESFSKAREGRRSALKTIMAQIAILQGKTPPAEDEELIIVSTGKLKAIRELALKEKAMETAGRLEMIGRGPRGFGGWHRGPRPAMPGAPGPRGLRGPRALSGPNTPGGQEEKKAEVEN